MAKTIVFFFIFGGLPSDIAGFTGLLGLSIQPDGSVCVLAVAMIFNIPFFISGAWLLMVGVARGSERT